MGQWEPESHWTIVDRLADIILENVEGCIVDIGMGSSTIVLSRHARKFKRKQYSCDTNQKKCDWFKDKLDHPDNIIFCGKSTEFIDQFNDKPALVFLDGDHRYASTKAEVEFFIDRIGYGGVIFLHDAEPSEEYMKRKGKPVAVEVVRKELELLDSLSTFVWPYTAGNMGLMMITKKRDRTK